MDRLSRQPLCWEKGPRLWLESGHCFEEGAVFVRRDDMLLIAVAEEQAVDSYNASFTCGLTATAEQAALLRDWLNENFPKDSLTP